MKRHLLNLVVMLAAFSTATIHADSVPQVVLQERHGELLIQHCQRCHGIEQAEANFRVDDLSLIIADEATATRWQKVLNALNSGEMPPASETALDKGAKADLLDDLSHAMMQARQRLSDQNGTITMRRLNRREYQNTLQALLGVQINVNELPADTANGRFDTIGTNLFLSASQFEQYLALGLEALEEAFEWEAASAVEKKLHFEAEDITPKVAKFIEQQVDAQSRASKWCQLVDDAVALPDNSGIVAEIRAGPLGNHKQIFYRNWKKLPGVPAPESFGFNTVEDNADKAVTALTPTHLPYHRYYLEQPGVEAGAFLAIPNEHPSVLDTATINLLVPFDWPSGNYIVRFRAAVTDDAPPERRYIEFGINPRVQQAISTHEITGTMNAPQIVELPLTMTRGNRERANRSLFLREKGTRDHHTQTYRLADLGKKENNNIGRKFSLWVDWMEIERVPTVSQPKPPGMQALHGIAIDDKQAPPSTDELRLALHQFACEAFRGVEPSATYIEKLMRYYQARRQFGIKHSLVLKETLAVILSSPMFLYLAEPDSAEQHRPLNSQELACRLSYFLWSAPPDSTLLELAAREDLLDQDVLSAQTERLLADPRSRAFVEAFTYQWLGLDRLDFFQVNMDRHPRFDNSTRQAAREEIYETVAFNLHHTASIADLLKSDYVVINGLLANYYGLTGVSGDQYRKVVLPADSPRGGLLGMAAVHLMGSNGDNTSPVERGAWVLRKLLNNPTPPAPPNIPQIARLAGRALTTRDRILAHREEPQCASCHRKIDPIGFGLENFDAVGIWRTEDAYQALLDNGKPDPHAKITWTIDASGALHNGSAFEDYFALRDVIASHNQAFSRGFSAALIQYGLGRQIEFRDEALIDDMQQQANQKNFAMQDFILALIRSKEFHCK